MSSFRILVEGDYACFTRPEFSVERFTYDTITPTAASGLIGAIHHKPAIRWVIDCICVLKPIQTMSMAVNELGNATAYGTDQVDICKERMQRSQIIRRDVAYVIDFHAEETGVACEEDRTRGVNVLAKNIGIMRRRLKRGQFFHQPCLGLREFPADVRLIDEAPATVHRGERKLGLMPHTSDSKEGRFWFWEAAMVDGVIEVPPLSDRRVVEGGVRK